MNALFACLTEPFGEREAGRPFVSRFPVWKAAMWAKSVSE